MLHCRILAMAALAQAHVDAGDPAAARGVLDAVEALADAQCVEGNGMDWPARVGVLLALADGDLDQARRSADRVSDPFWRGISRARVHAAAGDGPTALDELALLTPRCIRHEVVLALLRARLLDDADEAVECAGTAVELASAHGLLQTVAAEGAPVIDLVEKAAWRAPQAWLDRLRRSATAHRSTDSLDAPPLAEPLTARERDVLRFLPSRLTVQEIADELYVSVNTVKFHLRVIYRKLGVNSRSEAAKVARRMTQVHR
jgi:LuxR family maltose regulon positive regulatory protein